MHRVTYVHINNNFEQKKTYCFVLPDYFVAEIVVNYFICNISDLIEIPTGVAKCHPKDNYNKATGREIAHSNLEAKQYKVNNFYATEDEVNVNLQDLDNKIQISMVLKKALKLVKITKIYNVKDIDY